MDDPDLGIVADDADYDYDDFDFLPGNCLRDCEQSMTDVVVDVDGMGSG